MNGAEAVVRTLADCGVDTCFANPGTSEMHFVAALDAVPADTWRAVPVRGRGDRRGRRIRPDDRPPGGGAAAPRPWPCERARQPAQRPPRAHAATRDRRRSRHLPQAIRRAAGVRHRRPRRNGLPAGSRRSARSADAPADAAEAVAAALHPPGQIATLILPADVTWTDGAEPAFPGPSGRRRQSPDG